jgi:penicillin-binding protein 2
VAIGQGFSLTTPLQMTMAYAAIANRGILWKPQMVSRIEGNEMEEGQEIEKKLRWRIPVKSDYFDMVQKALLGVVEEKRGTAHKIKHQSFLIAGKTGTAQVVRLPDGANRKLLAKKAKKEEMDHAWFVGYAPADDPEIAVGVLVEHGGHGSTTAAPLAQKVMAAYLERKATSDD